MKYNKFNSYPCIADLALNRFSWWNNLLNISYLKMRPAPSLCLHSFLLCERDPYFKSAFFFASHLLTVLDLALKLGLSLWHHSHKCCCGNIRSRELLSPCKDWAAGKASLGDRKSLIWPIYFQDFCRSVYFESLCIIKNLCPSVLSF